MGCASRAQRRLSLLNDAASDGDYHNVISTIRKNKKLYNKGELLYFADIGVLFHYLGEYDSSNIYLEKSLTVYDDLYAKSITNEAASLVTNDNIRPYRSKPFEIIFIHQIMAFNYLAKGDRESALVETRRTQILIDEWNRKDRQDDNTTDDGLFQYISGINYNGINEPGNASVSLYKSLMAYGKNGITVPGQVTSMARNLFTEQKRFDDLASFDLEKSTSVSNNDESEIIVVGYGGRGPTIGESVWWGSYVKGGALILHHHDADGNEATTAVSAPVIADDPGGTFSIKFAMPMNRLYKSEVTNFEVATDDGNIFTSDVVNDMDILNESYLEESNAKNLARTVVRVVTRTIAAEKAKDALATDNPVANLFINITTDVAAGQLEKADTRSLFLLPKEIHMTRIKVEPGSHRLVVSALDAQGRKVKTKEFPNINVKKGEKRFLFMPVLF